MPDLISTGSISNICFDSMPLCCSLLCRWIFAWPATTAAVTPTGVVTLTQWVWIDQIYLEREGVGGDSEMFIQHVDRGTNSCIMPDNFSLDCPDMTADITDQAFSIATCLKIENWMFDSKSCCWWSQLENCLTTEPTWHQISTRNTDYRWLSCVRDFDVRGFSSSNLFLNDH